MLDAVIDAVGGASRRLIIRNIACLAFAAAGVFCTVSAQETPLYFVQLSDPQFGMYSGNKGFEQETANFEFAVASVNRLKPAFVVVTGDLVNKPGNDAQATEYLRITAKIAPSIPVHQVAGNHDVGNEPTPESLAAYRKRFGPDFYGFRTGPLYGIVLDSCLIFAPAGAPSDFARQEAWLKSELVKARSSGARHIVVFQHHPYFVSDLDETDEYHNIPRERRRAYVELLAAAGVKYVFAGHYHQNARAQGGGLEMITTGPVGNPLGRGSSGIGIGAVTGSGVRYRYFSFGDLPATLDSTLK